MSHDLSVVEMSHEAHAAQARRNAKLNGAADCIHFAPSWGSRSTALYNHAHEAYDRDGLCWFEGRLPSGVKSGQPYLIEDGRMVIACTTVWFVELRKAI
jgi:hypothetical protein